ncbi:hypothetical protein PA25_06810 [Pseudoalteromonas sp. A25]|uniref:NAD-dependent epimerase/dehydratase family protein n=1 Tax=Pseudoalteromonas sp. A25 TaxID=116092 RepID=UPI001261147A|nr:NAD-dependent epimerase/dehydratase family protein [Pseudoalteromonas sp. A25]BBN80696.1 hypothetical protein PA25_06810 [Pseudoalteromonas sp. A25]
MIEKSVLITGGTGNIGSAVVEELLTFGYEVKVLCKDAASALKAKSMGALPVRGALQNASDWQSHIETCAALIHTACTFDEQMGKVDYDFLENIAWHAAHRPEPLIFLYTSGCWTYGSHQQVICEKTQKSSTADFRWMLDSIEFLSRQKGIELRVVSPTNVVSEQSQFLPPILLWEMERCGHPVMPQGEEQTWSLIERRNLAQLYRLVLENGRSGEEYIGSAEHQAPIKRLLENLSSERIETGALACWARFYGRWVEGYGLTQVFSSDKAIEELGWRPKKFVAQALNTPTKSNFK